MAAKKKQILETETTSEIEESADVATIRKKFIKSMKNSLKDDYIFLEEDGSIEDVSVFSSSGCTGLDFIMANRKGGGYPVGKIVEVAGPPGSGKTLLAIHGCAEAQKNNGFCVYLDPENAFQEDFAKRVGLDISADSFWRPDPPPATMESLFNFLFALSNNIDEMKKQNKWPYDFVFVVWDSVAASPSEVEIASENPDPSATVGLVPRILSKNLKVYLSTLTKKDICLFCLNQLRTNIRAQPFHDPWITPGGNAIPFYASVRLRIKTIGKLKDSSGETVGVETEVEVKKTRFGPPFRKVVFPIYFTHGIDDAESIINTLESKKAVTVLNKGKLGKHIQFEGQKEEEAIKKVDFKKMFLNDAEFKSKVMVTFEKIMTKDLNDPRLLDLEVTKDEG